MEPAKRPFQKKVGRPPKYSSREILEAIIFVAREGIRWEILPDHYPPKSTVHRWFQRWVQEGIFDKVFQKIVIFGENNNLLNLRKSFIDGMFIRSKNGSEKVGKTKCGKGHKMMALVDDQGIPIAIHLESATPHEVKLVESTLDSISTSVFPDKVIGDKAYDSDKLDEILAEKDILMIAPHRENRVNKTQDGRALRSYKKRWKVEDFNCRIQRFRKIMIRYELYFENFMGFLKIAAFMVVGQRYGLI